MIGRATTYGDEITGDSPSDSKQTESEEDVPGGDPASSSVSGPSGSLSESE